MHAAFLRPWINGRRVGQNVLAPGWTDYRYRIDYHVYDITSLLSQGENAIGVHLGDGWFSGFLSEPQFQFRYGADPSLLAQLVIDDGAGSEMWIGTGPEWLMAAGPIRANAIYHGETYDARREIAGWSEPGKLRPTWKHAHLFDSPDIVVEARHCPPILRMEERVPLSVDEPSPGTSIFDLGENITG